MAVLHSSCALRTLAIRTRTEYNFSRQLSKLSFNVFLSGQATTAMMVLPITLAKVEFVGSTLQNYYWETGFSVNWIDTLMG